MALKMLMKSADGMVWSANLLDGYVNMINT